MNYTLELSDLMEHEKVIEQGLASFVEVGYALLAIRDGKKYRAKGFETFERYCAERWDLKRQRAYEYIGAAEAVHSIEMSSNGRQKLPTSERQARPLTRLAEPEHVAQAWERAQEIAIEVAEAKPTPTEPKITAKIVERAVAESGNLKTIRKPTIGGISHPARYSDALLPVFAELLADHKKVLDPFAGTGRIHELEGHITIGVEIEPEWATLHPDTIVGNALVLPFDDEEFDAICTSPCYGNRLADSHNAIDPGARHSYTHDLGRTLSKDSSGAMQWGDDYRKFHVMAWAEAIRVLRPGGVFVLNISDHIRNFTRCPVSAWHATILLNKGLKLIDCVPVSTSRLRAGENADARVDAELVWAFQK